MMISFRVYGIPQTKGSTKAFMQPGMRFPVITNDNSRNKNWAATVSGTAQFHRPDVPFAGPVGLTLKFFMPKPKSYPKTKTLFATKRPDLDKMVRSIKDSLKGVMYFDDAQVVWLKASKAYDDAPGVEVKVVRESNQGEWLL
jgi:Holliday junction resolvase RusA-like endonuclease